MSVHLHLVISLGKTAAQIVADFAPVPALAPAVELLCGIMELCENMTMNRSSAKQLRDRCHELLLALRDVTRGAQAPQSMQAAIIAVQDCLMDIKTQMHGWTMLPKMDAFLRQKEINRDIEKNHAKISDCLTRFEWSSHMGIHRWQEDFEKNSRLDQLQVLQSLSEIQDAQALIAATVTQNTQTVQMFMSMMQNSMAENIHTADRVHTGLSTNLFQLQEASGLLLPNLQLRSGEVARTGQFPVRGTAAMDIYEGLYLKHKKVSIKVIRAIHADDKSLRRFLREVKIWSEVWRIDRGKRILPFYGFGQNDDEPFPFMVSPWPEKGDALTYVKSSNLEPRSYLQLIKGIGEGIEVLHGMNPPVVHGDIKAVNVAIDRFGQPLLADFGLSQIVEDITGVPFTQSRGVADSYRWFAPEVCVGQGLLSCASDIYAYAMTMLEILTHEQPYREIKHTTEVVITSSAGKHPRRPTEPPVIARGLDDDLWMLFEACWNMEPGNRPTVGQLLEAL
ncbi:kinase-like domain-containing protein [Mucidula mucida]|nr:kinase-like domain-containing protein [Mucidula mucida]